jgi:hypothetical protein
MSSSVEMWIALTCDPNCISGGGWPGLAASARGFRGRGRSAQETGGAQIFVDIRPMNTVTRAADFPVSTLFRRCVEKPWIPDQGNNNCSAVEEVDR